MKTATLILLISFSLCMECPGQTASDKRQIYEKVIQTIADKKIPIINEVGGGIAKYDIDGDVQKWFYRRGIEKTGDSSKFVVSMICALPVTYSQSVISYLSSKGISANTAELYRQADITTVDSLSNYMYEHKFVSWRKAPMGNSAIGNLFKKKKVVGLSRILADSSNNIALVRVQVYSKKRTSADNPSKIIVLKKEENDWVIIGELK